MRVKLEPIRMEQMAGAEEFAAGRELDEAGQLRLEEQNARQVRYTVAGKPPRSVTISASFQAQCDCDAFHRRGCCRHVVAAWQHAERERIMTSFQHIGAPARGQALLDAMTLALPTEPNLHLEPTLALAPGASLPQVRLGFRVGQEKRYVLRDYDAFFQAMDSGEALPIGRGFVYEPAWMCFSEEDERLLRLARRLHGLQGGGSSARLLPVPDTLLGELLGLLRDRPFRLMEMDGSILHCKGVPTMALALRFEVAVGPRGVKIAGHIPVRFRPLSADCAYGVTSEALICVEERQRSLARTLWEQQYDGVALMEYPLKDTERVIGEVLPWLKLRGAVEVSPELQRRLVQRPLRPEVYLDRDGGSVVATVQFHYGDITLNPFAPVGEKITLGRNEKLLLRDAEAEHQVLTILANAGFRVGRELVRLSGNDAVYDFVSDGVHRLQEVCEVYLSREFKRIVPRHPALRGGLRLRGDQLELMLEVDGEPSEESMALLEALSRRRRYFRLKTGEYLDLSDLSPWQEAAAGIYEAAVRDGNDLNRDAVVLRAYRAAYLQSMLAESQLPIEQDEQVRHMAEVLNGGWEALKPNLAPGMELREYQQRGFEWMAALDRMHMGGVLADDMGLGKTAQVIALLSAVREPGRVSLIVAPTSLTYNWMSELKRFAPKLEALVLTGTGEQRAQTIARVLESGELDVLITSYPLIRRDIALLKDYRFRFAVLDEAQNVKNAGSMAAAAVRQLQADSRFALTGTPMENGVGELWSIFDFVLPGYLPAYNAFLRRYQDGENAEDLLRRIRPFLTRRLKQDVLSELPDKQENVMVARMTPEQEKVYRASLDRLRPRVNQLMEEKGFGRSHMEVLSALTELREICCHPALVLEGYRGGSGKEELLRELLPGMIAEGRRVLLFSQFTRMLRLLQQMLEENGYTTLYLDGDTPADERLQLTERFNGGEGDIFLISLRAGGSGLNLTGADTVIHYDPWWNPAAEDQATDRAHRIGQTKKVQVVRLVTGESIEEQVVELGARKKALFDRLITPGESTASSLTEQEIRSLFL